MNRSFIIGGVAFSDIAAEDAFRKDFELADFRTVTDPITGMTETKCKQVCGQGDAVKMLNDNNNARVRDFLALLDRDGVYVHVSSSNIFYYSVISEIAEKLVYILGRNDKGIDYGRNLASIEDMLYDLMRDDKLWFMEELRLCGYPDMTSSKNIRKFCDDINARVRQGENILCGYPFECDPESWLMTTRLLNHVGITCLRMHGLDDVQLRIGPGTDRIVESLCDFYWSPCLIWFPSSTHTFDHNRVIKERMRQLIPAGIPNANWEHSANEALVQASDIWVGLYAKYEELIDKYCFERILPNYIINPRNLDIEESAKQVTERTLLERARIEQRYAVDKNVVTYNVQITGLGNKFDKEMNKILEDIRMPNINEATDRAVDEIYARLNKTGRRNIRLMSQLIVRAMDTDTYNYRVEDSETTLRLRTKLIRGLASA